MELPVLAHFKHGQPITLETDASRTEGLGYSLMQECKDGVLCLIQAGSRLVRDVKNGYSTGWSADS